MSNPEHLSSSQRRIRLLESTLDEYKQMQKEYNCLLNYLCIYHGVEGQFMVSSDRMKLIEFWPIRTEISDDGKVMTIERIPPTINGQNKTI